MRESGEQQGSLQSTWGREGEGVEGEALPARLTWVNDSEWEPNEGLVVVVAKVVGGCCMVVLALCTVQLSMSTRKDQEVGHCCPFVAVFVGC